MLIVVVLSVPGAPCSLVDITMTVPGESDLMAVEELGVTTAASRRRG
jgi:hypothetical protein